ncbi:MAG: type II toxin-antitoxin system VapC family toxin [Gemmatimonadota bacterium]
MRGLDTNVLVRLLVADDAEQTERATELLQAAESIGESFFVSTLVLLELTWVLESAYECPRAEVLEALEQLAAMPVLRLENLDALHRAIAMARKGTLGIPDLLIGCCAAAGGCTSVVTFDKQAADSELFEPL